MSSSDRGARGTLSRLLASPRLAAAGLLVVALVALWHGSRLSRWSFDGPGPGLFPMLVAAVCALLALLVWVFPGQAGAADSDAPEQATTSSNGRDRASDGTFVIYSLALLVLAGGASFAGFTLTCLSVAILIVRFAEGRSWRAALLYGTVSALIGLVGFGWLLRVDLPMSGIDRALLSVLR